MSSYLIGVALASVGNIMINLSSVLIKSHHMRNEKNLLRKKDIIPDTKSKQWLIGILLFVIGNICNFLAFNYAAQSLLAALGSIQFVSNVFFTYFILHHSLTSRALFGTGNNTHITYWAQTPVVRKKR